MHATATLNNTVIASTDNYQFVEGNVYFPPASVDKSFLTPATLTTACPWKGTASYYNISVPGGEVREGAWFYPTPITKKAEPLKDFVAFYKGKVDVVTTE